MGLREFLERPVERTTEASPRSRIAKWKRAVSVLTARFKNTLGKFEQLQVTDWTVLRDHAGIRYNAEALTIEFGDNAITLEPNMIDPEPGVLGRASLNCGVREIHLDCGIDSELWRYHWVIPYDQSRAELSDDAIEKLVEELFRSTSP